MFVVFEHHLHFHAFNAVPLPYIHNVVDGPYPAVSIGRREVQERRYLRLLSRFQEVFSQRGVCCYEDSQLIEVCQQANIKVLSWTDKNLWYLVEAVSPLYCNRTADMLKRLKCQKHLAIPKQFDSENSNEMISSCQTS